MGPLKEKIKKTTALEYMRGALLGVVRIRPEIPLRDLLRSFQTGPEIRPWNKMDNLRHRKGPPIPEMPQARFRPSQKNAGLFMNGASQAWVLSNLRGAFSGLMSSLYASEEPSASGLTGTVRPETLF